MAAFVFVAVLIGVPLFLVWVKLSTAASNAKARRILARPEGPRLTPAEIDAVAGEVLEEQAHRAYTEDAVNGRLPDIRPTLTQRVGTYAFYGVLAHGGYELFRHER